MVRFARVAGAAGVLSIVMGISAGLIDRMWTFPSTTETAAQVAAYVDVHRTALLIAMAFNTIAVILWLGFGAGVWATLRTRQDRLDDIPLTAFAWGFITFITLLLAGFTAFWILVARSGAGADARLLYDLTFGLLAMSGIPTALALSAYAVVVRRTEALPLVTAHLAVIAAISHIALLASFFVRSGFFSLEGAVIMVIPGTLFAWIACTGVAMVSAAGAERA
jgi:hypothetical protein